MTTELEQEFYDTFGIEKQKYEIDIGQWDNNTNSRKPLIISVNPIEYKKSYKNNKLTPLKDVIYPKITDHKLLEIICVLSQWDADNYYQILANNMQDLKNEILNDCINFKQKLKNKYFDAQIQQLFKGEE